MSYRITLLTVTILLLLGTASISAQQALTFEWQHNTNGGIIHDIKSDQQGDIYIAGSTYDTFHFNTIVHNQNQINHDEYRNH